MAKTTPVDLVKTDPLYVHHRINLSVFINSQKFFGSKEKQDKAAVIYQKMMSSEKELKDRKGKGPEHIQQMPSIFNLQEFTKKTSYNPLTAALREHFDKGSTNKAAWDYITLKQSAEEFEKLKQVTTAQTSITKCVYCKNIAAFFCYQCKSAFCYLCRANYHDILPPSKDHSVIDLKSVNLSAVQIECSLHKSEYTYYCVSCKTLVCSTCVTTDHAGHKMSDIKGKAEEIKQIAKSKLSIMKRELKRLSLLVKKTKTVHIPHLDEESGDAIASIRKIKTDLDKIIQTKADIKINEIEDLQHWRKEELQSTYHNMERTFQKQTAVCESLETLLSEEHSVSFLVSYQTLERDLYDLTGDLLENAEPNNIEPLNLVAFLDDIVYSIQEYKKRIRDDEVE